MESKLPPEGGNKCDQQYEKQTDTKRSKLPPEGGNKCDLLTLLPYLNLSKLPPEGGNKCDQERTNRFPYESVKTTARGRQ